MNETQAHQVHPKTGHPVQEHPTFEKGDLVTEYFLGDGYPAVVVHATPKTVYVHKVAFQGNFQSHDLPGYNGYGDSGTIAVDPESVEKALAAGKEGATKYVLRVSSRASNSLSIAEREKYGSEYLHRASWRLANSTTGVLRPGASYRRDPHV